MPESEKTIHELMAEVSRNIGNIAKDRKTESGAKYNFRGIDDVFDAIHQPLADAGIITRSKVVDLKISERESQGDGGKTRYQTVVVLTKRVIFTGPNGDSTWTEAVGEAQDYGDKAVAKAESVSFRTAMIQAFTIPIADPETKIDTETDNSDRSGNTKVAAVAAGSPGTKPQGAAKKTTKVQAPASTKAPNLSGLFAIKGRDGKSIVPNDDDARHKWATEILKREITSYKDLTQIEVDLLKAEAKKLALATPKPDSAETGYGESEAPF